LNKIQEEIIKAMTQFPDGPPIEPKSVIFKWSNDYGVLVREKCKITYIDWRHCFSK
jgi:RIO-like serine/threonine protein kinase